MRQLPRLEWPAWVRRILKHPASSYIAILLLQFKVIWGMWWYREMTMGDTEAYFIDAASFIRDGKTSNAWSPLYSTFIAELFHFSSDAYTVLILHRVLIVVTLAVLVLALMRRLLSPGIAWLAAAWWVVVPIDFDDRYEVHMFAVIPLVLAPLAVLWLPGAWGRGSAIAILLIEGLLVRNENFASAVLLTVLALSYEFWWNWKLPEERVAWKRAIPAYGVPLLCAILFASYYYVHRMPYDTWAMLEAKHDLNVCESFAVGYQQRTHDFDANPMGNCGKLMQRLFGASITRGSSLSPDTMSTMSLMTALRANPPAMLAHFKWNVVDLLPGGLQVLLFNSRSGEENPDYVPTRQFRRVRISSAILCALLALGAYLFFSERKQWMEKWRIENTPFRGSVLEARIWAWITLGCVCLIVGSVIVTVRPRPAYLFILGIAIRAVTGLCAYLVVRRWPPVGVPFALGFAFAFVVIALTPSFYVANYKGQPRPLFTSYERIAKYRKILLAPGSVLVSASYSGQLCSYVGKGACRGLDYYELRTHLSPARRWANVLDAAGATVFYADEAVLDDPAARDFISHAKTFGWETVAARNGPGEHWALLERMQAAEASQSSDITLENERLALGSGWYGLEVWENARFRWSSGDAQILVTPGEPLPSSLSVDIAPGPSVRRLPLTVQVLDRGGKAIQTVELDGRVTIAIPLPRASVGPIMLVLHATDGEGKPVPNDPRSLKFRVFKMLLNW